MAAAHNIRFYLLQYQSTCLPPHSEDSVEKVYNQNFMKPGIPDQCTSYIINLFFFGISVNKSNSEAYKPATSLP